MHYNVVKVSAVGVNQSQALAVGLPAPIVGNTSKLG